MSTRAVGVQADGVGTVRGPGREDPDRRPRRVVARDGPQHLPVREVQPPEDDDPLTRRETLERGPHPWEHLDPRGRSALVALTRRLAQVAQSRTDCPHDDELHGSIMQLEAAQGDVARLRP